MLGFATWNLVVAVKCLSIINQVVRASLDSKCRHYFCLGSCATQYPSLSEEVQSCCKIIIGCFYHNCWEALLATSIIRHPFFSSGCQKEVDHKTFQTKCPLDSGQWAQGLRSASRQKPSYRVSPFHETLAAIGNGFVDLEVFSFGLSVANENSLILELACNLVKLIHNLTSSNFDPCPQMDSKHTRHDHLLEFDDCTHSGFEWVLRIMHIYFASFSWQYYFLLSCSCNWGQHYSGSI